MGLWLALFLYGVLVFGTVRAVGLVGEVDIGWALAAPPRVLVQWSPPIESESGGEWALFEARQTRPLESLVLGAVRLPLATNSYTGGAPDWPARLARAATGAREAGVVVHVLFGALLLALAHRFLRFHGTPAAAGGVALLLASDWVFVFFKKVLGGTEILLQTAGLLVLWSLWSRRWKGGRHGTVALALGVGLGLGAKVTFVATLVAFGIAAMLTRWDRPNMRAPERVRPSLLVTLPLLCVAPLVVSWVHHLTLGGLPEVISHDTLDLQLRRLTTGTSMGRESVVNLTRFLGNPVAWLGDAWGTVAVDAVSGPRLITLALAAAGALIEWRSRTQSPSAALLRFLSLAVPLQLGLLFLLNRDLHHLAQATVPLALLVALGADRVAGELARPRSTLRAIVTSLCLAPAVFAGLQQLRGTDGIVRTARAHSFTTDGQLALTELLRENGVQRLVVANYELYGLLEQLVPEVEVVHGWGAVSRKDKDLGGLRAIGQGGHYLWVRPSAPFIYDWRAEGVGPRVGAIGDGEHTWAELFRVE
ncbi:MAG: hypothetical protein EXR71_10205 [Myxococcales bacterium]|nr:hypothetical protein [Myxococcales bacterium]